MCHHLVTTMYHNACHLVEEKANKSMKPCERTSNSLWSCSALLSLMQYLLPKPRATTAWEPDGIWDGRILSMIGGWAVYRCRKPMSSAIELFTSTRPCHPSGSSRSFLRFLLIYGGTILPTNQLGPFVQWESKKTKFLSKPPMAVREQKIHNRGHFPLVSQCFAGRREGLCQQLLR